ncbi:MucB/RseB C-terminal domain-containing protein [Gammaproteobacteria bacterium AS21]|jgi:negative regulator of sigma E activity
MPEMHDKSLESISAMMDGEVEGFVLRRAIERTASDTELKDKWHRYHLAQDIMQSRDVELSVKGKKIDLVASVSAALEDEPVYSSANIEKSEQKIASVQTKQANTWWKPVASMAVAASVTAVVLLGSGQFTTSPVDSSVNTFASAQSVDDAMPASRFGNQLSTVSATARDAQPNSLRAAHGMEQYIQTHNDLAYSGEGQWQVNWMPEGFAKVKESITRGAEVLLYQKGESTISINIESIGTQASTHGVLSANDLLAYGVNVNDKFVTVVGKLSAQDAAKIAASVSVKESK